MSPELRDAIEAGRGDYVRERGREAVQNRRISFERLKHALYLIMDALEDDSLTVREIREQLYNSENQQ